MTGDARAALVAAAKPRARAIVNCVAASSARGLALHLDGLDPETQALVLVLAEAADHRRLARVCAEPDDGLPDPALVAAAVAAAAARRERHRLRMRRARAAAEETRTAAAKAAEQARKAAIAARAAELAAEKRDRQAREAAMCAAFDDGPPRDRWERDRLRKRRDRDAARLRAPESTQSPEQALPGVSTRAAA